MSKFRGFAIALILGAVIGIGGCATQHSEPASGSPDRTSETIDKDKVFKKDEESDDMERLD